jgi:hypothetical protein
MNVRKETKRMLFIPDTFFMGANKNDSTIREMLEYLKERNKNPHFSSANEFLGNSSQWCLDKVKLQKFTLIGGEIIGTKTAKQKTILIEDLMEDDFLDLHSQCCGIYIPHDEVLKRNKYQWFAVLSSEEVLKSTAIVSKYLKSSIVDTSNMYIKEEGQIIKSQIPSF